MKCKNCSSSYKPYRFWQKFCCPKCRNAYNARLYRKSPEYIRWLKRKWQQKWRKQHPHYLGPKRQRLVDIINNLKKKPCSDCHKRFSVCCMDFDHVKGKKVESISVMVATGYSEKKIKSELIKCELVCANCHRIRTFPKDVA